MCGGFAVAFSVVVGKPTINGILFAKFFELCLPESDYKLFLHNKYIG